jgi:hypothetical protein
VLVYGDQPRREPPQDLLHSVLAAQAAGDRTRALIEAGELAQGLADAEFAALGEDDDTPLRAAALALCVEIARRGEVAAAARRLADHHLPDAVEVKTPEGYAFYGLYPDSYRRAALAHAWPEAPFVIGLRSIGTSLAAVVAAATRAAGIVTVRPTGEPFRRSLRLSPALEARLAAHEGPFAIVDEGPGLSGSSFGAAADRLEALGVARERIVFLPSHAGDLGPQASPAHRSRWRAATRLVDARPAPVADWFADLTGRAPAGAVIPGTTWKTPLGDGFVARFAGLGATGERKLARARALHAAGFGPEPLALRRGQLLQRRVPETPWRPDLDHLSRYLSFRRRAFPAPRGGGDRALVEMVRVNVGALLGEAAGRAAAARLSTLPLAAARPQPVYVDARLHREKWRGGVKLDALDHGEAHDLVGPQDIAWDVAGAAVEFGLSDAETARLAQATGADPVMLRLFSLGYPAFQAGRAHFAGDEAGVARYRDRLLTLVAAAESAD